MKHAILLALALVAVAACRSAERAHVSSGAATARAKPEIRYYEIADT